MVSHHRSPTQVLPTLHRQPINSTTQHNRLPLHQTKKVLHVHRLLFETRGGGAISKGGGGRTEGLVHFISGHGRHLVRLIME